MKSCKSKVFFRVFVNEKIKCTSNIKTKTKDLVITSEAEKKYEV